MNRRGRVQILLVEDNPDDAELAILALNDAGIANEVHVVGDGVEALAFLRCEGKYSNRNPYEPPNVVLLDLKLPKVNGLEVLAQIRGDPRTQQVPVVLLTSSQEQSDVAKGYKNGANAYIVKPIDFKQFSEAIRHIGYFWLVLNHPPPVVDPNARRDTN
ncbi:response regulator [Ramlibacter sp. PS4R-6]|uniref:response regulator n=1 Tax=Ramlibacter sp. PS4R-6 TaxID=3133438 RepID=UPI0030AC63D8